MHTHPAQPSAQLESTLAQRLMQYPLLQALIDRRSRRFAAGAQLNGGPLAYTSAVSPQPLSVEEEAALAFAACGVTGYALAELPYDSGAAFEAGNGNIITHFIGRTTPSGDAIHAATLFVINDCGAWLLKRPQDYPRSEIPALLAAAREQKLVELYDRARVRIADRRIDVPRETPFIPPFNKWSANLPGTSYFLPVHELSALYINVVLAAFSEQYGGMIVDERNRYRPAGVAQFARSRGGHLQDDPASGRVGTVGFTETWLYEFTAFEEGAMLQNLALMAEALGLGGFAHFAAYPAIWMQALGFRMAGVPLARTIGASALVTRLLTLLRRNLPVPTALGLERDGAVLIKPFCPPYYPSMKEAVLAFIEYKYASGCGTFRDGGAATAWRDGARVTAAIPRPSDRTIDATIAYCEYIYQRYGRFPASSGPFRTVLAFQAHHLDPQFYDQFYRADALTAAQRQHAAG
jgi:hypothetical protein